MCCITFAFPEAVDCKNGHVASRRGCLGGKIRPMGPGSGKTLGASFRGLYVIGGDEGVSSYCFFCNHIVNKLFSLGQARLSSRQSLGLLSVLLRWGCSLDLARHRLIDQVIDSSCSRRPYELSLYKHLTLAIPAWPSRPSIRAQRAHTRMSSVIGSPFLAIAILSPFPPLCACLHFVVV
jgi:hypothetical protein